MTGPERTRFIYRYGDRRIWRGRSAGPRVRGTDIILATGISAYGGALSSGTAEPLVGALHASLVGLPLYVAHLRDGYVDGHRRGEETPRPSVARFRVGIRAGGLAVLAPSGVLLARAGLPAAISILAVLLFALLRAPSLDCHPLGVTVDYPVGIAIGAFAALPFLGVCDGCVGSRAVAAAFE
jgi:hypothetical protein